MKAENRTSVREDNRFISFGSRLGIKLGQSQGFAQRGNRDAVVRLGFRAANAGRDQRGLGINQLRRERESLLKTATNQLRAFLRLLLTARHSCAVLRSSRACSTS